MSSYTLQANTELMRSHKAAQVLSDQASFQVLQTSAGQSLFFSVGDTNILYLSSEQDDLKTGWLPIDLTTELALFFPSKTVTATAFAVCQSALTGDITIVQAVHVVEEKCDYVFALVNLSNDANAAWMQSAASRLWLARPFDGQNPPISLVITYVDIPLSQDTTQTPYVVIGVQAAATGYIQNYIININGAVTSGIWTIFETAENYETLQDICLGMPQGALGTGLYELYSLNGTTSLLFTPMKRIFGPPNPTKLSPPAGASSIAVLPADAPGTTNLYVAGTAGIYFFAADAQTNFARGTLIVASDLIANVVYLEVHQAGNQLTLWGRNNSGTVFCSRCDVTKQTDPNAWSSPIPLLQAVDQLASMLDLQSGASVLYAHTASTNLVKLSQDPVTTQWRSQSILLPTLNINEVEEFYTYTTHITVSDVNGMSIANQTVSLTATSPGNAYLNDAYVTLSSTVPLMAVSGFDGTFTLVQETKTLGAICYNLVQGDSSILNINPMNVAVQRMTGISNGATLRAVNVTDEDGNVTPLVSTSIPSPQSDAVAHALVQFVKTSGSLPQDGSLQPTANSLRSFDATLDEIWGLDFSNNDIQYFNGPAATTSAGFQWQDNISAMHFPGQADAASVFEAFAGDIFKWLEGAIDDVEKFYVQVIGDISHFFIQLGKDIYHFVMQCINDVVHAIQFILKKIKVAFDDLVKWLGFIFAWKDIVRTHKVLKNILKQYALNCFASLGNFKADLQQAFTNIEDLVNAAAGLPPITNTSGGYSANGQSPQGSSSPQAHYGSYQAKSNGSSGSTAYSPVLPDSDPIEGLLNAFLTFLQNEMNTFQSAYQQLKTQVVDVYPTLTVSQVITRVITIIFDVLLESMENAMLAAVDIITALLQDVIGMLDTTIDIPVLSWLYKKYTGDDLSILDLGCLIVAIPVTIIVKLVGGETPFPDNNFTSQLINAPDF